MSDKRRVGYLTTEMLMKAQTERSQRESAPGEGASEPAPLTPMRQDETASSDGRPHDEGAAAEPAPASQPKRTLKRRISLLLVAMLALGMLGWIGIEQLGRGNGSSGGHQATETSSRGGQDPTADATSVDVGVRYQGLVGSGRIKEGCKLAVNPASCEQGWLGKTPRQFLQKPQAIQSAVVAGSTSDPSAVTAPKTRPTSTVVLVTYQYEGESTAQRWAVLVRDSDHKVIASQTIGADETGMSLDDVGKKMQEDS